MRPPNTKAWNQSLEPLLDKSDCLGSNNYKRQTVYKKDKAGRDPVAGSLAGIVRQRKRNRYCTTRDTGDWRPKLGESSGLVVTLYNADWYN